jgi:hypothetical protein
MSDYPYAVIAGALEPTWRDVFTCDELDAFIVAASRGQPVAFVCSLDTGPTLDELVVTLARAGVSRVCVVYELGWPGIVFEQAQLPAPGDFTLAIIKAPLPSPRI